MMVYGDAQRRAIIGMSTCEQATQSGHVALQRDVTYPQSGR